MPNTDGGYDNADSDATASSTVEPIGEVTECTDGKQPIE